MIEVLKIRISGGNWYTLPTPMGVSSAAQVLDGGNSGRDANTGIMYRDIVRSNVSTVNCTLPAGIKNGAMADILNIILSDSFEMEIPDIRTGTFQTKNFYCATAEPTISKIISRNPDVWEYEEFSFQAIEM